MIISHKHKFIFFKTRKTAGTSLEVALSRFCDRYDVLSPLSKEEEEFRFIHSGLKSQNYLASIKSYSIYDILRCIYYGQLKGFWDHASATEVKSIISKEKWESYYKFAFDRNPWDKVISFLYWSKAYKKYKDIDDFLFNGQVNILSPFEQLSIGGVLAVDRIYKYEKMQESLVELTDILNLPERLNLPDKKMKGDFRNDRRHYSEVLTIEQAKIIKCMFAREIELMNYSF